MDPNQTEQASQATQENNGEDNANIPKGRNNL